jgi:NADH:ubiquinone oxidoreductase subunit 4 (subunit M)
LLITNEKTQEQKKEENNEKETEVLNKQNTNISNIKNGVLQTSIISLWISLFMFSIYDFSTNQFQFVQEYHKLDIINIHLGIDGLSIYFILLISIIIPISLLSN